MRLALLSTGEEVLRGEILDRNAAAASAMLDQAGFEVVRRLTCGDGLADLVDSLRSALAWADAVVVCGGLGPTEDDRTVEALAELLDEPLVLDETVLRTIRELFAGTGMTPSANQDRQARRPASAEVLPNPLGTAPGLMARIGERRVFCLPGPPVEFEPMLRDQVLPRLERERAERADATRTAACQLNLFGRGEGWLAQQLGDLGAEIPALVVGWRAAAPEVQLKLRVRGARPEENEALLSRGRALARERLGDYILSEDGRSLPEVLVAELGHRGQTLAVAESCTGGLVGKRLTDIAGASAVFLLSVVSYADEAKTRLLGVKPELLAAHGAVSPESARAMAEGVRAVAGADWAVSVTGIAGPAGGSPAKPVGTVFFGLVGTGAPAVFHAALPARDRTWVRSLAAHQALDLVRRAVLGLPQVLPPA